MTEIPPVTDDLPEAIRRRIETELLVERLLARADLRPAKRDGLLRHPAMLVTLTFLLTGAIGSLVTSIWQTRQWSREQTHQAAQDLTIERVEVMNRTTEAIAESFTAAEDVLHFFDWDWSAESPVMTLKESAAAWNVASHQWRVQEKVLLARVAASFDGPHVDDLLRSINAKRRTLGNDIQNLLAIADNISATGQPTAEQTAEIEELRKGALEIINETTSTNGLLGQLSSAMVTQIRPERPGRVK